MSGVKRTHWKWCKLCRKFYKGKVCIHDRQLVKEQSAKTIKKDLERIVLIE